MSLICEHVANQQKRYKFSTLNCFGVRFSFQDRHIPIHSNNGEPVLDPSQDYVLLSGRENASHTILRFRRKLRTCDEKYDVAITVSVGKKMTAEGQSKPQKSPTNPLVICQTLTINSKTQIYHDDHLSNLGNRR